MKHFQKTNDLTYILLLIIFVLNTFDGISTYIGIKLGFIEEGNYLLSNLPPSGILLIKLLLSVCVIYLTSIRFSMAFKRKFNILLSGVLIIYLFIASLHIFWMSLYF
jgi:hypothetical protein